MDKIETLTPYQERQMIEFREKWRSTVLATVPADIKTVKPVIESFYKRIDKSVPYIWRVASPLMAQVVINLIRDNLGANLWANLGANLGDNLGDNLRGNLRANLWANRRVIHKTNFAVHSVD